MADRLVSWARNTSKGISSASYKARRTAKSTVKKTAKKARIVTTLRRTSTQFWMRNRFLGTMREACGKTQKKKVLRYS
jgi:hypothetical protein